LRFSSTLKCVASCVSERKAQPYVIIEQHPIIQIKYWQELTFTAGNKDDPVATLHVIPVYLNYYY
jgi:hypothetical protein